MILFSDGTVSQEVRCHDVSSIFVYGIHHSLRTTYQLQGWESYTGNSMRIVSVFPMFVQMINVKQSSIFKPVETIDSKGQESPVRTILFYEKVRVGALTFL